MHKRSTLNPNNLEHSRLDNQPEQVMRPTLSQKHIWECFSKKYYNWLKFNFFLSYFIKNHFLVKNYIIFYINCIGFVYKA